MTDAAEGPLKDLVVIEMGTLIAGPFAGQILGDFGARVIKIEDPKVGDPMRQWGRSLPQGLSPWWPVIGRNKQSVGLDLRTPEGRAIAGDLIAKADVLIENFRPGTMEKWGLGYEALSAINPRLIMARVSGFGQTGPYATRAGYGLIGEAMGGLRHVTGEPDRPPARAGISIGDSLTAMHAVMGITMALHHRANTGRGQMLDVALYESVLAVMENLVTEYDLTGYVRERSGSILPGIAPSNVYPCAQGELILIGGNGDTVFARLAQTMGRPELAKDPKFVDHASRGVNQGELDDIIADWTKDFALADLLTLLEADGIPSGRIFRAPDMLENEQFQARDTIVETDHPVFGKIKMQNTFPRMSETPGKVRWPGPTLGQHTDEVLTGLAGLDAARVAELRAKGIV
ncbi:MAG: CaiB/BaiF CoA-transferase family protein [Phenylobacterium sp.]|uniref:CaiB/BaiF CoA transferase family protein n=1 Tax=Phenylobacterium sp. TaxID=1871053 RepID=UPI0027212AB1|nr:CaiB/BaiF CoA-transferase family protein [Phenylobacterium sp.]MDO8911054.1 CaiB/BaiF CoA-transferase family protein [Phenylobacterium sp.]MDP3099683.1 CaiB/BaiF CoA-transferase family protein [Phenylobacterium sp.]HQT52446.1 CaiB/BaiF CoA-transferase family protein [Phenylobacterium sp.]